MTDEEFAEDAERGSLLGAAVMGVERTLRCREADYRMEEKLRTDKDAAPLAGEPPEEILQPQPRLEKPVN
jgi:hypothetical protein